MVARVLMVAALVGALIGALAGTLIQERSAGPAPAVTIRNVAATSGFVRGMYGEDSSPSGRDLIAASGFTTVMASHYVEDLDALRARHLKGIVWLGGWSDATCSWEWSDAAVKARVKAIANHPAVLAYYMGDEPTYSRCPRGPAIYKKRTALVHSVDPNHPTYTVIAAWDEGAQESFPYAHWKGAVDVLGFDVYPCAFINPACEFWYIDQAIAAIRKAGITKWWAVLQDFQDDWYRMPTATDLKAQFDHWRGSGMSGYLVFSWNYGKDNVGRHPDHMGVLRTQNTLTNG